ncbi:MAG: hypothetical protein LC781_14360 [Actinobacteria bacterium]|nr:hypothetical protein [Actinomycetota bacterium]
MGGSGPVPPTVTDISCRNYSSTWVFLANALAPEVGYDRVAEISRDAYMTISEVACEKTDLTEEELSKLLDVRKTTEV